MAHPVQLAAKLQKMQDLLDAITTPNVSYFDMTPAEEIARLEARVKELESEVKVLTPYRYLHPGVPEELDRCRAHVAELEAILCGVNAKLDAERNMGFDEGQSLGVKNTQSKANRYREALLLIMRVFSCDRYNPDGAEPTCRDQVPTGKEWWCPHCIACEALEPKP